MKIMFQYGVFRLHTGVLVVIFTLEPLLISGNYQQRSINSEPKTASDSILEPLLMTFSIVVHDASQELCVGQYDQIGTPIMRMLPVALALFSGMIEEGTSGCN
jgi:hypothetical protein